MSAVLIADKLRASLLQAAIQGKLTKQLPADGDARDLLKEIEAEKVRLIEEKVIRKEKPLPSITEDEFPFEIPKNWAWVRLGDVTYNRGQKAPNNKFTYIDIASIDNKNQKLGRELEIIEAKNAPSRARKIVQKGDLIYATVRPYLLNICIIDRDISPEPIVSTGFAVLTTPFAVMNRYLLYLLISPFFNSYANDNENAKGVAYPAINDTRLKLGILPIPPLAEQYRIVEAIEMALAKIDKLKIDEDKLDKIQKVLPNKLRSALLQSAIQGKLTEQLPTDGDARDLLKEIEAEKTRMIEEKIIRKEKPLPAITDEEIPFEIPENWTWVRLGDVAIFINGDRSSNYPTEKDYTYSGIPFFGAKDMRNNLLVDGPNLRFIGLDKFKSLRSGKLQDLDFVCLLRGSIGKFALFYANKEYDTGFINAQMVIIRTVNKEMVPYFENIFKSAYFEKYIRDVSSGTAVKQLAAETLRNFLLPLPPIQEQRLVVEGLNEVMGKINHLIEIEG